MLLDAVSRLSGACFTSLVMASAGRVDPTLSAVQPLLEDAVAQLLKSAEEKGMLDPVAAKEAGFCPLRYLAEYLMRNNPSATLKE